MPCRLEVQHTRDTVARGLLSKSELAERHIIQRGGESHRQQFVCHASAALYHAALTLQEIGHDVRNVALCLRCFGCNSLGLFIRCNHKHFTSPCAYATISLCTAAGGCLCCELNQQDTHTLGICWGCQWRGWLPRRYQQRCPGHPAWHCCLQ